MKTVALLLLVVTCAVAAFSQRLVSPVVGNYRVSDADLVKIMKAEDARNPLPVNEMLGSVNAAVRYRAALAAGRIGSESSLDALIKLLSDSDPQVDMMAAFAIGEIESIKGADSIVKMLNDSKVRYSLRARAAEAAGKIAAANPKEEGSKKLGQAILNTLEHEYDLDQRADRIRPRGWCLLELTAALRARPEGAAPVVAKFITNSDPRIRVDALNTLARLRSKERLADIRTLLEKDTDPVVRANSARVLGAADDKGALDLLLKAATSDTDSRVRVSAIRAVNALKIADAFGRLVERGRVLLREWPATGAKATPTVKNELLEIANTLAGLVPNSKRPSVWSFLTDLRYVDRHYSPEVEVAMAKIDPAAFIETKDIGGIYMVRRQKRPQYDWKVASNWHAALGEYSSLPAGDFMRQRAQDKLAQFLNNPVHQFPQADPVSAYPAIPSAIDAYARFKSADLDVVLRRYLVHTDPFVRASAAGAIADLPVSKENIDAVKTAALKGLFDAHDNDALLAAIDALYKLDPKGSVEILLTTVNAPDYLVRKKSFELLNTIYAKEPTPLLMKTALAEHKDQVQRRIGAMRSKLGRLLNIDADYRRALSRKNGSIKAVLTTQKGAFTIVFTPEEAPLTVDNFVKLARSGYFNGLEVHRVVPNFVMQDGDPRGDGNGGPGWSIRCEINMLEYDRGAVGMALSGKDTGGSQWFVTHSPQPHLDGGYTIFGHVNEQDMRVVDKIVRGDRILSVRVIGR